MLTFLLGLTLAGQLVAQEPPAARRLFDQTKAQAGKGDAEAMFSLASFYSNGTGTPRDPAKAIKWYRRAADKGQPRAQYQLGVAYAGGIGVKPDKVLAAKWYRQAAEQRLAEAELALGLCFLNGDGVPESGFEAAEWFRKSAAQELPQAVYELGNCFVQGIGVAKDLAEGTKKIRQAAHAGYPPAQNHLGRAYERGIGVPKDLVLAYKWFSLAAAKDDQNAPDIRVCLARLETTLTSEQVSQAQRLAAEFKPGQPIEPDPQATPGTQDAADAKTGTVLVKAEDELCEVFVDGTFAGNSPAKLKLSEGAHVIEVKRKGFADFRRELKVVAGSDLTIRAVLEKTP